MLAESATLPGGSKRENEREGSLHEVAYHKAVIAAIETVLIPASGNKELLQQVVPTLKAHLDHAEMVQSKISR